MSLAPLAPLLPPFVTISSGMASAAVQVIIALVASGVAVKLLTLRQDRRKIAGDASTSEANAASTLSGAALQMVEVAQKSSREAEQRAQAAVTTSDETRRENERIWRELNKARWEIYWLRVREEVLESALRTARIVVPRVTRPEGFPDYPPPDYDAQDLPKGLPPGAYDNDT